MRIPTSVLVFLDLATAEGREVNGAQVQAWWVRWQLMLFPMVVGNMVHGV
jgi:hypothetical protein